MATLVDPLRRAVYAEIIERTDIVIPQRKRERAIEALLTAGLIEPDEDDEFVATSAAFTALLDEAPPVTRTGLERFVRDGRIEQYPARPAERLEVLEWAAARAVGEGETISEQEVNDRLGALADDVATLRRFLVDAGLLERDVDGARYWARGGGGGAGAGGAGAVVDSSGGARDASASAPS